VWAGVGRCGGGRGGGKTVGAAAGVRLGAGRGVRGGVDGRRRHEGLDWRREGPRGLTGLGLLQVEGFGGLGSKYEWAE